MPKAEYVGKAAGGKLLRLGLAWEGRGLDAKTVDVRIRGDFFAHPEEAFEASEAALTGIRVCELGMVFERALRDNGVELYGLLPGDIDVAARTLLEQTKPEESA